jgi:hypothetical protein
MMHIFKVRPVLERPGHWRSCLVVVQPDGREQPSLTFATEAEARALMDDLEREGGAPAGSDRFVAAGDEPAGGGASAA